jgi:WD40 repeat protein
MRSSSRVYLIAVVLTGLAASMAAGQDAAGEKAAPKAPSVAIPADKLELKPGDPLSIRALVTRPPALKGVLSWSLETRRHRGNFNVTALSPDGKWIATGGLDGTIRLWDTESGKLIRALIGHSSYVYGLAFSPDGNTLASGGSFDSTVRLWDVRSGLPLKVLKGHPAWVAHVAWSPDGKTIIAAGGQSGVLSRWDAVSGNYRTKFEFGQPVRSMAWRPNGNDVAVACAMLRLQIWSDNSNRVARMLGNANDDFHSVAWSPDGKTLAAGTMKSAMLFDGDSDRVGRTLNTPTYAAAWSSDGKLLATSNGSGAGIRVWEPGDGTMLKSIHGMAYSLHFMPDDRHLIGGDYTAFSVWKTDQEAALRSFEIAGTAPPLWWNGRPLVTGVGSNKLLLWDSTTGKLLRTLEGHEGAVQAVAWSPDGKTLVSASADKTVRFWEANTGKIMRTVAGHTGPVRVLAFSPDGKNVASGGDDKNVVIWDAGSGKLLHTLKGHENEVTALAWAPGLSGLLASGGNDKTVRLWTGKSGQAGKVFTAEGETQVSSLTWSTDAKTLVSGHHDHRVRMWQVATGKVLHALEIEGSPPQVSALAWAPNDTLLASGRSNHTLQIWNVKTAQLGNNVQTMAPVQRVSWSPDSRTVICSSSDRTTRFFEAGSGALRGVLVAEELQVIAISIDGHFRADATAQAELIYVAQLDKGQETFSVEQFTNKFRWRNNPGMIKLIVR